LVRRASGGGAILHDRELTYSIALPVSHPAAARATTLYDALHESLIAALADRGIAASLCAPAARLSPADEPFLCFQRRSPGDVLCGQFKIAGSAQRRRGGAIVQHGSVLLSLSEFAPELPGLAELSEKSLERGTLSNLWGAGIAEILGFELVRRPLDTSEKSAVDACACRYSDDAWTRRR
jgi:lipoate-protein ligase A